MIQITNGNGSKTDIGIWFVTYNTPKMWENNFGKNHPIQFKVLLPNGKFGIPLSDDIDIIDFFLENLADAKIDFILFDLTNGGLTEDIPYGSNHNEWIVKNAILTCDRISLFNKTHNWKIRYAVAVGCYPAIRGNKYNTNGELTVEGLSIGECTELQAKATYLTFIKNSKNPENYYCIDGKPLLIIHDWGEDVLNVPHGWKNYKGNRTYGDKFTVRNGQGGQAGTYGWQTKHGTQVHPEVEVVCPGQNTHGANINIPRLQGKYYLSEWEKVLSNPLPRIVMITSLNDYNEDTAIFPADTSLCDLDYEEHWIDSEGKENPYMYWKITCENIKKLREINGELY